MAKRTQDLKAAAAMAALMCMGGTSEAAGEAAPTIVLHVTNHAGTPRTDLALAEAQAERIFKEIGVRVVWSDITEEPASRGCGGLDLFVSVLSPSMVPEGERGGRGNALGSASTAAHRAFIHSERVKRLAAQTHIDERVLLGRVIAHEVGHLLLPDPGHTKTGLMAARMDTSPTSGRARFSTEQAGAIQALLKSKAGDTEARQDCGTETASSRIREPR